MTPSVNCKIHYYENEDTLASRPERQAKYGSARKFYSCNNAYDYLTYVSTGTKKKIDYVEYSGDSEKSSGVFDGAGLMSAKQKKELRQKLRTTKSVIWDCILTFRPEFGQKYCNDYSQAHRLMVREFPRFLKSSGFDPKNITWFAGLHTNKKHRHIHTSFFENAPIRVHADRCEKFFSQGKIPLTCIEQFKVRAEMCLTDITAELKIARKEVTSLCNNVLFSKDSLIRYDGEFRDKIVRLVERLPCEGRLGYDSENMRPLIPLIRQIIDAAIKTNPKWHKAFTHFCGKLQKRDDEVREMLIRHKIPERQWQRYLKADIYLEDLYRRLGNQIINYARVYKKKERPAMGRLARKRIRERTVTDLLLKSAQMQAALENDAMFFFRAYLKKLDEAREDAAEMPKMEEVNEMG